MNKSTAKAFLATVMAAVIMVLAFSMFYNSPVTYGTTYAPSTSPEEAVTPVPELPDQTTPDPPAEGTSIRAGRGSSGGQTTNPPVNPSEEYERVAIFDGHWGFVFRLSAEKKLHCISSLQGSVYAKGITTSGQFIDPWLQVQGTYQENPIYIKFSIDSSSYNGVISFKPDFSVEDPISGSYWDDTDIVDAVYQRTIAFFTWSSDQYWIYGRFKPINDQTPRNTQQPPFIGYWGKVANAQPIGALEGQVVFVGERQTAHYAIPWLYLKTKQSFTTLEVSIRYPLRNPVQLFEGYLMSNEDAVDILSTIISGTQSHVSGGTGISAAFFTYKGEEYWILGIGTRLT